MAIDSNSPNATETGGSVSCDLIGIPSFLLQIALGLLAFSTLLLKRYREPPVSRRSLLIWMADTTKQGLGMLEMHFVNLLLSQLLQSSVDHCILYLMNFLLDSTVGLLIIYVLLKIVACLVHHFKVTPLKSGEYGFPFKMHYWLAQCSVLLLVMLVMKLIVEPLLLFHFWDKVGATIMPFQNKELRTAIVIFIIPFIVNVIMFWIVDSIIMRQVVGHKDPTSVSFKCSRPSVVYIPVEERELELEECMSDVDSEPSPVR